MLTRAVPLAGFPFRETKKVVISYSLEYNSDLILISEVSLAVIVEG